MSYIMKALQHTTAIIVISSIIVVVLVISLVEIITKVS